uniref:Uncharacterized protein n=1 Tax=Cacopsylla melanoneura TaxID=428564 RepID=A0A8D8ZNI8_9HEMI
MITFQLIYIVYHITTFIFYFLFHFGIRFTPVSLVLFCPIPVHCVVYIISTHFSLDSHIIHIPLTCSSLFPNALIIYIIHRFFVIIKRFCVVDVEIGPSHSVAATPNTQRALKGVQRDQSCCNHRMS